MGSVPGVGKSEDLDQCLPRVIRGIKILYGFPEYTGRETCIFMFICLGDDRKVHFVYVLALFADVTVKTLLSSITFVF